MINGLISMNLIDNETEFARLGAEAKKDNHGLFLPTHTLKKTINGKVEPVGYFSIGHPGAVITFGWLSRKEIVSRETFHLINMAENLVQMGKQRYICFPVPITSPLHTVMSSMDYKNCGSYDFFVKDLTPGKP